MQLPQRLCLVLQRLHVRVVRRSRVARRVRTGRGIVRRMHRQQLRQATRRRFAVLLRLVLQRLHHALELGDTGHVVLQLLALHVQLGRLGLQLGPQLQHELVLCLVLPLLLAVLPLIVRETRVRRRERLLELREHRAVRVDRTCRRPETLVERIALDLLGGEARRQR